MTRFFSGPYGVYWFELSFRLGCVFFCWVLVYSLCFQNVDLLFDWIRGPVEVDGARFVWLDPKEVLNWGDFISQRVSGVLVYPFFLLQVWLFLRGGLVEGESKVVGSNLFRSWVAVCFALWFSQEVYAPMEWEDFESEGVGEVDIIPSLSGYLKIWLECFVFVGVILHLPFVVDYRLTTKVWDELGGSLLRRCWFLLRVSMVIFVGWWVPMDLSDSVEFIRSGVVIFEYCVRRKLMMDSLS